MPAQKDAATKKYAKFKFANQKHKIIIGNRIVPKVTIRKAERLTPEQMKSIFGERKFTQNKFEPKLAEKLRAQRKEREARWAGRMVNQKEN